MNSCGAPAIWPTQSSTSGSAEKVFKTTWLTERALDWIVTGFDNINCSFCEMIHTLHDIMKYACCDAIRYVHRSFHETMTQHWKLIMLTRELSINRALWRFV